MVFPIGVFIMIMYVVVRKCVSAIDDDNDGDI